MTDRVDVRSARGFTLIEVLLVVTMIGIIAAIATPKVQRARATAMEAATIGSLRALHTAQTAFASTCGAGYFAPSIPWLARVPAGGAPYIGPQFTANVTDRYGYRVRFTAGAVARRAPRTCNGLGPGRSVGGYFVGADVQLPGMGVSRFFGVHGSGVIYESRRRIRPLFAGTPPAPARPIQ